MVILKTVAQLFPQHASMAPPLTTKARDDGRKCLTLPLILRSVIGFSYLLIGSERLQAQATSTRLSSQKELSS
jgi:hypothetical protein